MEKDRNASRPTAARNGSPVTLDQLSFPLRSCASLWKSFPCPGPELLSSPPQEHLAEANERAEKLEAELASLRRQMGSGNLTPRPDWSKLHGAPSSKIARGGEGVPFTFPFAANGEPPTQGLLPSPPISTWLCTPDAALSTSAMVEALAETFENARSELVVARADKADLEARLEKLQTANLRLVEEAQRDSNKRRA